MKNNYQSPITTYLRNELVSTALAYLLIAAMLVCVAAPIVEFGERVTLAWQGGYLLLPCFIVALEAMLSWRAARRFIFPSREWFLYRATELVVIFISLKAVIYSANGWGRFLADLLLWQSDFRNFFNGEYLFAGGLILVIWVAATRFAILLVELEGDEQLYKRAGAIHSDRAGARQRLIADITVFGSVMLFSTALLRSDFSPLYNDLPAARQGLLNVVLYFVLGLLLLAQSQLAVLRARWSLNRIPVKTNIALRWAGYSLGLLVVCAALAVLLPTRYSLGLLDTLAFLIHLLQLVLYFILFLLFLPINYLLRLLMPAAADLPLPSPNQSPFEPNASTEAAPMPWFEVLRSIFFWTLLIALVGFSLYYYLRQRTGLLATLGRLPGWRWFAGFWRWLWGGAQRINTSLVGAIKAAANRMRPRGGSAPWGFINLRRLSPRDQIRFYYLALVRRAGDSGLQRRPAQTPFEYESDLAAHLPESDDLNALTSAFVEAQYSRHEIPASIAALIRKHWENLKRLLRSLR